MYLCFMLHLYFCATYIIVPLYTDVRLSHLNKDYLLTYYGTEITDVQVKCGVLYLRCPSLPSSAAGEAEYKNDHEITWLFSAMTDHSFLGQKPCPHSLSANNSGIFDRLIFTLREKHRDKKRLLFFINVFRPPGTDLLIYLFIY